MTAYHRSYFRSRPTIPTLEGSAPVAGTRGLLPNAAARTLSSATPPVVRKVDDKGRIYHPDFAELAGWAQGTACTVAGPDLGAGSRRRTRRRAQLGSCPGERSPARSQPQTG